MINKLHSCRSSNATLPCLLGEVTSHAAFHLGEVSRHRLALGLFSFYCFFLSPVQKMYLTQLIRTTTNHSMFGVKCRQIVPSVSLQSSLHMKAGKG